MTKTTYSYTAKILSRNFGTKFFLAGLIALFASCKKESDLGIELQPESDIIGLFTTDTTTLRTYTVREDSLRTDESPTVVIGSYVDPVFGKSNCGVFSQFVIPNNLLNINFGSTAVLDSAVLTLSYNFDYYGDTTNAQTFRVYQMTEGIDKDSTYYSNRPKSYYPGEVGSLTFNPKPRTRVAVGTDTVPAHIRIPIDQNFAQLIFAQSGTQNLASNADFIQYLKGLYIAADNPSQAMNEGALLYFDMLDSLTEFKFYYHTATDTTDFSFVVNTTAAYYSYYQHDYSAATTGDIVQQLNNPFASLWPEVYVQSNAGVKTKIEFPFLENYKNLGYPIAINKAELVIKGDPTQATANLPLNTRFYTVSIDSVGKEHLLIDMFENSTYFGGSLNTTTNEYKINIARYIQAILNGEEENNGIYLKEIFATENGRRSVIGSGNSTSGYRMYLRLVYTRIN